jgi:Ubiquitin carboxyl-terminal hydrolase.
MFIKYLRWDVEENQEFANLTVEKPIGFTNAGYDCSLISIIQALHAVMQRFPEAWKEFTQEEDLTQSDLIARLNQDFRHSTVSRIKSFDSIKSLRGLNFEARNKSVLVVLEAILKEMKKIPSGKRFLNLEYIDKQQRMITYDNILKIRIQDERYLRRIEIAENVNILTIALTPPPTITHPDSVEVVNTQILEGVNISKFELVAVINYERAKTGHFTCLRKDLGGKWWYCNDNDVPDFKDVNKNSKEFQKWKPHILFYVKKRMDCTIL